jgi:hypothetical protein
MQRPRKVATPPKKASTDEVGAVEKVKTAKKAATTELPKSDAFDNPKSVKKTLHEDSPKTIKKVTSEETTVPDTVEKRKAVKKAATDEPRVTDLIEKRNTVKKALTDDVSASSAKQKARPTAKRQPKSDEFTASPASEALRKPKNKKTFWEFVSVESGDDDDEKSGDVVELTSTRLRNGSTRESSRPDTPENEKEEKPADQKRKRITVDISAAVKKPKIQHRLLKSAGSSKRHKSSAIRMEIGPEFDGVVETLRTKYQESTKPETAPSELAPGSVAWGKLAGYPWFPLGVLCFHYSKHLILACGSLCSSESRSCEQGQ